MDLQSAVAAAGSMKAAIELSKTIIDAKSQVERQAAVSNLQQALIGAQMQALGAIEAQAALKAKIDELQREITARDDWSSDAARYELADAGNQNVAYRLREDAALGTVQHWLCPDCFANRKKSFLSVRNIVEWRSQSLDCKACGKQLLVKGQTSAAVGAQRAKW